MNAKKIGEFISTLRKQNNMTQKDLAQKLQVTDKAVSKWETGKGIPDIEFLLLLSQEFSVSINELLTGEKIEDTASEKKVEEKIAKEYINIVKKESEYRDIILGMSVVVAFFVAVAVALYNLVIPRIYEEVMGTRHCVIVEDYSYIMLMDQKYVPFHIPEGLTCEVGEILIYNPKVEGVSFLECLLFEENVVYSIKNCPQNEIVYLQGDYGLTETGFYCLESKVEEYTKVAEDWKRDTVVAQIRTGDVSNYNLEISEELLDYLESGTLKKAKGVDCYICLEDGDDEIALLSIQKNGIYMNIEGILLWKGGEYYFRDFDDSYNEDGYDSEDGLEEPYTIDGKFYEELDRIFSYKE